jgi:hypothetical protein
MIAQNPWSLKVDIGKQRYGCSLVRDTFEFGHTRGEVIRYKGVNFTSPYAQLASVHPDERKKSSHQNDKHTPTHDADVVGYPYRHELLFGGGRDEFLFDVFIRRRCPSNVVDGRLEVHVYPGYSFRLFNKGFLRLVR